MAQAAKILIKLNKDYSASDVKTQGVVIPYLKGANNHIEATHEIASVYWTYYSYHYQRGNWLRIGSELLTLLKCHAVDDVWYFSDHECAEAATPISIDFVLGLYEHYANN